jgi:hypothetical protein
LAAPRVFTPIFSSIWTVLRLPSNWNWKWKIRRRYSQTQSPGSMISDFIKDDIFILDFCSSISIDLAQQISIPLLYIQYIDMM